MKKSTFWIVLLILGFSLYAGWKYFLAPQPTSTQVMEQPSIPTVVEEPPIRFPIPETPPPTAGPESATVEIPQPLPTLEQSDASLRDALKRLYGGQRLDQLLIFDNFIKRVVITTDNLLGKSLPAKRRPTQPVAGVFLVSGAETEAVISPENARRYTPFIRLAQAAPTKPLVALYVQFYPLFQQAYRNLGYRGYFNDRLVEVIDHLLASPRVEEPIRLARPEVLYQFAEPQLEALSSGQKLMIRIGRENADQLKTKLRELREALTSMPKQANP